MRINPQILCFGILIRKKEYNLSFDGLPRSLVVSLGSAVIVPLLAGKAFTPKVLSFY